MAEIGRDTIVARRRARLHAQEVLRGSVQSRRAVTAARLRRACLAHRPVVAGTPSLRRAAVAHVHDWSRLVSNAETVARAEAARGEASMLRRDAVVLRGAVAWQLRRLKRTHRQLDEPVLTWTDGPGGLDDILV
jgi:hypothetical protein